MANLKAIVQLGGKEFDVISYHIEFSRKTDTKGRPVTDVIGGRLTISIEAYKDTSIVEAMLNGFCKPLSGRLKFLNSEVGDVLRIIEFKCAYLVHYKETFNVDRKRPFLISVTFSSDVIIIGDALLNNRW